MRVHDVKPDQEIVFYSMPADLATQEYRWHAIVGSVVVRLTCEAKQAAKLPQVPCTLHIAPLVAAQAQGQAAASPVLMFYAEAMGQVIKDFCDLLDDRKSYAKLPGQLADLISLRHKKWRVDNLTLNT